MRFGTYLIAMILMFISFPPFLVSGEVRLEIPHVSPDEVSPGEVFYIFVLVKGTSMSDGFYHVYAVINNNTFEMKPYNSSGSFNRTEGVLYYGEAAIQDEGTFEITFFVENGDAKLTNSDPIVVSIRGSGTDDEGDTILGLPRTYCAISMIFITLILIFLTWSYFKGRKLQRSTKEGDSIKMFCSECGAEVKPWDKRCPGCGALLDEEEHVCGNCGASISETDVICPHCGARLKNQKHRESIRKTENDPDLKKLGKRVDMTGKIICENCGTVFIAKEGKCPECGKSVH